MIATKQRPVKNQAFSLPVSAGVKVNVTSGTKDDGCWESAAILSVERRGCTVVIDGSQSNPVFRLWSQIEIPAGQFEQSIELAFKGKSTRATDATTLVDDEKANRFYTYVGPRRYQVRITSKPLPSADGCEAAAIADESTRTIWISAKIPPEDRWAEIDHESWHLHVYHYGKPEDEEVQAKFHAQVCNQVRHDIMQQGLNALLELREE